MRMKKLERQQLLKEKIEATPFITDEELAQYFQVSVQTIRLDRLELSIPELRKRIKTVATSNWNEMVKTLPLEEVIGEIIDLQLDDRAISILNIQEEHVFSRNKIARGHHLFAQANSLAVALIDDDLALTKNANITFTRQVNIGEQVVAKAHIIDKKLNGTSVIEVESFVKNELVFSGTFYMYRSSNKKEKME